MSRFINQIIIHCSASANGKSLFTGKHGDANFKTPVQAIDSWHKARGFKRDAAFRARLNPDLTAIGYHFVVYTNGTVVTGRHLEEIGAHVYGNNKNSIGVCMLGTDAFTAGQFDQLKTVVEFLIKKYPQAKVLGHRECSPDKNNDGLVQSWEWLKTCPGFDVRAWCKAGYVPDMKNVLDFGATYD